MGAVFRSPQAITALRWAINTPSPCSSLEFRIVYTPIVVIQTCSVCPIMVNLFDFERRDPISLLAEGEW